MIFNRFTHLLMKMAAYEPFFAFEDVEVEDVELENVEVEENPSGKRY